MVLCGFRYLILYVVQLGTIIDCVSHFGTWGDSKVTILQLMRLFAALYFSVICMVCDQQPIILSILMAVYSGLTTFILISLCTFYNFKHHIIELYLHLFSVFFGWGSIVDQLFIFFKVKELSITDIAPEESSHKVKGVFQKSLIIISHNSMAISTLAAVILAILTGCLIRAHTDQWTEREQIYVSFFGEIFLRILKCLVLPLIFSSLVYAFANIDLSLSGKIACRMISLYAFTTFSAIFLGIGLVLLIKPGANHSDHSDTSKVKVQPLTTSDALLDLVRNIFPENVVEAMVSYQLTVLNCTANQTLEECDMSRKTVSGANVLGVVMFAVIMGVVVSKVENHAFMVNFFRGMNDIFMEMTIMAINIMPFCVIFLIMPRIISVGDLSVLFGSVGWYSMTVIVGLMIHALVVLPTMFFVFMHSNPYKVLKNMVPSLIMGFGTSSSSVTMPVTIKCLEERCGLDRRIVRFCIPIGTTINMDGTALYEAVAAIFISQYRNVHLSFPQIFVVALTATAASVGAAGIPQAGLVTMIIVLNAVNLPAQDAALIILVDWALDRLRTVCNILGDCYATCIVDHLSKDEIENIDKKSTLPLEKGGTVKDAERNQPSAKDNKEPALLNKGTACKFVARKTSLKSTQKNNKRTPSVVNDQTGTTTKTTTTTTPSTATATVAVTPSKDAEKRSSDSKKDQSKAVATPQKIASKIQIKLPTKETKKDVKKKQ